MIRLLGLAGEARCGKSSAAGFLRDTLGFEIYALSAPIKDMMCALFDWDQRHREGELKETVVEVGLNRKALQDQWAKWRMEELVGFQIADTEAFYNLIELLFEDDTAKEGPFISPRRAFQLFGTEYGRGLRETIWLDIAKRRLDELPEDSGMIIADIRFPNEHKWIARNGGFLIHVRRKGAGHTIDETKHESEAGLKRMAMDWVMPECENLEQLKKAVNKVADFAEFAHTSELKVSPRLPTFEQVYEGRI